MPLETRIVDEAPGGWYKLELVGNAAPAGQDVHYVRLSVPEDAELEAGTFQLGHAVFRSMN